MVKNLFINACILIASISLGNQIFNTPKIVSLRDKSIIGLLSGLLGIILMLFSVQINETTILDFRMMAIILSALYGGAVASITTGLLIGIFRIVCFGINNSSIVGLLTAIIMGIGCGFFSNLKLANWKKWILLTLFCLLLSTILFIIILQSTTQLVNMLVPYWIGTSSMSVFLYFYTERLNAYNLLFHNFKTDASIDFVTGLNNVRQFDRIINRAILNAKENQESLSVLYLDIDFFKKINDTYGHPEGDVVLRHIGQQLKTICRSLDLVFRIGGDEFAVLLLDCSSEAAVEVAQRIKTAIELEPLELTTGTNINLTVSIGVATFPDTVAEVEMLMEKADNALYKAKHSGRNKIETA